MVLLSIGEISKNDRALISVLLRKKKWSSWRLWREFSGKNWVKTQDKFCNSCWRKLIPLAWVRMTESLKVTWPSATSLHVGISKKNIELVEELICSAHLQKSMKEKRAFDGRIAVRCLAKHDLQLKTYKRLSELLGLYCHSLDGATLYSKNKLMLRMK